jgi:putative tricarboxylic transport membrane protein
MKGGVRPINRWDRVTGYVFLVIGLVTAWSSVHLSMGKLRHPGPGFFPFGLALCLILLSLALIFRHWKKDDSPTAFWPGRTWLRPLLGVTILFFYALVVEWIGFLVTTFIFLIIWMGVIERLRWRTILSISVGTTVALYFIFSFLLEVPLPSGFLNW